MRRTDLPEIHREGADPEALLRAFVEHPVPAMAASEAEALRERVTRALEEGRGRAWRAAAPRAVDPWRPWLLFAAAASLPIAIWAAASKLHAVEGRPAGAAIVIAVVGQAAIAHGDVERSIAGTAGASLCEGEELRTGPESGARASLPTGAFVEVGPSARLRFEAAGGGTGTRDRLELVAGRVQLQVPKLAAGDDLRVRTAGAVVIVHGTRFSVEHLVAAGASPGETRVSVTEGVVAVESSGGERRLVAGMNLVVPEPLAVDVAPGPVPSASASPEPAGEAPVAASSASSTLSAENALLAEAMASRRGHEDERALARLDRLLTRYPASPLTETARVERLRVLEEMGATARLGREAERYLADYPRGFGRGEATRFLAEARSATP
jgi:hypothetical protein